MSINVSLEMKSFIRGLLDRVTSATASPALGRWGIQYDERVIDRKINQANEDHCGCCVADDSEKKKEREAAVVRYEKREEYLVPYVM
jgi:hypothetical protein